MESLLPVTLRDNSSRALYKHALSPQYRLRSRPYDGDQPLQRLVRMVGLSPTAYPLGRGRSIFELHAQIGAYSKIRTCSLLLKRELL